MMTMESSILSSSSSLASKKRSEQLDAYELDKYLLSLLNVESLGLYFPKPLQEYLPILRNCFLPTLIVLQCFGQTPACQILGLQVTSSSSQSSFRSPLSLLCSSFNRNKPKNKQQPQQTSSISPPPVSKLLLYSFLSFFLPELYRRAKTRWILHLARSSSSSSSSSNNSNNNNNNNNNDENTIDRTERPSSSSTTTILSLQQIAQQRRQRLIQLFFQTFDTIVPLLRLGLMLSCWSKGTISPDLGMCLAGLNYSPIVNTSETTSENTTSTANTEEPNNTKNLPSSLSPLHVLFAHRRWFHYEATRLLPILVNPLVHSAKEIREVLRLWFKFCFQNLGRYIFVTSPNTSLQPTRCPICRQDPVHVPYETNCGHVYCYTCVWTLVQKQQQNSQTYFASCVVCQAKILECRPVCPKVNNDNNDKNDNGKNNKEAESKQEQP